MRKHNRKNVTSVYVGFMILEVYDRVNREALWQVLRIYDVDGKLLSGIKSDGILMFSFFIFRKEHQEELEGRENEGMNGLLGWN